MVGRKSATLIGHGAILPTCVKFELVKRLPVVSIPHTGILFALRSNGRIETQPVVNYFDAKATLR
jgi:hypothetical protein